MREGAGRSGDFVVLPEGDSLVKAILPAGCFTHALSDKLNGTLRSPVLPPGKAHISFQVIGERSSAVRLVSNNCQLNYKNYRALTSDAWQWITFSPPADRESLRTYAELMTMFDNPKFPDQLSALGGDGANYKLPWEKAAENPRSHFGVRRVVLHDGPEPPRAELAHLRRLFDGPPPANLAEVEARYAAVIGQVIAAFEKDTATDDDALWLDALVRRELLTNRITARVMVNRVWHHLFGVGLVRTVDDFGHVGERPSHPELLDFLAARFVADGWSVKRLIRAIVTSRTFRASNVPSATAQERDPQNRLLAHFAARRMEAEAIRDSILTASGRLNRSLYGMSVPPYREKENADRRLFPGPLDGDGRRGVYIKNTLMEAPKFLGAFNFPGGKVTQGRRDVTNVPAQALALLNDPFVIDQADVWGM